MQSMKEISENKKNVFWVMTANLFTLFVGGLTGIILPKFVSMYTYSEYRTYTLFLDYVGIFHFGFINGIYLKYGSKDYYWLPAEKFRSYFRVLLRLEICVQISLLILGFFILKKSFIMNPLFFVCINIGFTNINCYFSLINQFTKRFQIDGKIQIISASLKMLLTTLLIFLHVDQYIVFLIGLTIINIVILLISISSAKKIVFGVYTKITQLIPEMKEIFRRGIFVNISEYVGIIILGIDSFFINIWGSYADYSVYALAVSVISLFFMCTTIISKLIFPYLMRMESDKYGLCYELLSTLVYVVSGAMLLMVYVCACIIPYFLPDYVNSLKVILILAPTIVIRSLLDLVCGNFYKVLALEKQYFINNVLAAILGIVTDAFAWIVWGNIYAIAYASLLSFLLWYCITDSYIRKKIDIVTNGLMWKIKLFYLILFSLVCLGSRNIIMPVLYLLNIIAITILEYFKYCRKKKNK